MSAAFLWENGYRTDRNDPMVDTTTMVPTAKLPNAIGGFEGILGPVKAATGRESGGREASRLGLRESHVVGRQPS